MAKTDFQKVTSLPTNGNITPNRTYLIKDPITGRLRVGISNVAGGEVKTSPGERDLLTIARAHDHVMESRVMPVNVLPNAGRGIAETTVYAADAAGVLNATLDHDFYYLYNNPTVTATPFWEHNNGSFGGSRTVLDPHMVEFIEHLGLHLPAPTGPRYDFTSNIGTGIHNVPDPHYASKNGFAFVNVEYTAPADLTAGTHQYEINGEDYWLSLNSRYITSHNRHIHSAYWIRVYQGKVATLATARDDVLVNPSTRINAVWTSITPADGWVHIACVRNAEVGYGSATQVYAQEGTVWEIAMPHTGPGSYLINRTQHISHILSDATYPPDP